MVDFKKIKEEWESGLTPEQREKLRRWKDREARLAQTTREIESRWTILAMGPNNETVEVETIMRTIDVVFIPPELHEGHQREPMIDFRGGPTGYESYYVGVGFCQQVLRRVQEDQDSAWAICAGTPGRWPRCTVKWADILDFLEDHCPERLTEARRELGIETDESPALE